ncbi:NAD(P)-binding protein, partial [Coprinopsis marcescibilis]
LLVLSAADVEQITASFLPLELQVLMAQVFSSLSQFSEGHQAKRSDGAASPKSSSEPHPTTQTPHRTSITMENHTALFMPARLSIQPLPGNPGDQTGSTSIKIVAVPRSRGQSGLPATTVVLDEHTGAVKAIVNARKLTALRNAAGSLLSTILVATRYPRRIVAFGAGAQIEAHLYLHLKSFTNVQHVTVINRTCNSRATRLPQHLASTFPSTQFVLHTPADGQTRSWNIDRDSLDIQADLVICATSSTEPLFPSHWIGNNTHFILIGSYTPNMHEIDSSLVRRS